MKFKRFIAAAAALLMCSVPPVNFGTDNTVNAVSYSDMPEEYVSACEWVWNNRIYDDENEDWMKDYSTIFDQLIAGNGNIHYLIRWDSYQTITLSQRRQLEAVLNEALNKWNDCLEGYENWPFDDVNVEIVGWSVLDKNCLPDLQADEVVYTETIDSTMRDYIIESNMAADASAIPTLEPSEPTDLSRYVHWSDKSWTYNGSYDNRYDMFLEGIDGLIDMGGFGWHYGQYLSSNAILGLLDGSTSRHVLLHEMGHSFGFPDYYGGIGESDGIPPGDFPGGEGSIMEAGRSMTITSFDTWFARYAWTKLSAQEGRFDMSSITQPATEATTETTIEPTTEAATEITTTATEAATTTTETTTTTIETAAETATEPAADLETIEFEDTISAIETNDNGGIIIFSKNGTYNFSGTDYFGDDESKNLLFYESGDVISIRFTYHTETGEIVSIESLSIRQNIHDAVKGDVNADGVFNTADIVMLQKRLLCAGDITDWQAGDLFEDGILNVLDLCAMKRNFCSLP